MKTFILMQYFMVTMVLTVSIGLFTLKPVVNLQAATTAQVADAINTGQYIFIND